MALEPPARRKPLLTLITAALTAVAVLLAPAAAYAAPDPSAVEKQIEDEWNKLEPIIEQYNKVHGELQQNQAKVAELQKKLQPLQLQVDLAMAQVGEIAAQMYRGGPISGLNAVLTSGSPQTLADQLSLLNMIARNKQEKIQAVVDARNKYAAEKQGLDKLVAEQAAQDADLAAKRKTIEAKMTELQKLRQQVYGNIATNLRPVACPVTYIPGPGNVAAKTACAQIGKPYVWATSGPRTFDCSGLTLYAWAAAGVRLRHYTGWQWSDHKPVSRADLRPGDLVFFFRDLHHMGMYVGDGWMVHAPTTGDVVRMARIDKYPIAGYRRPAG